MKAERIIDLEPLIKVTTSNDLPKTKVNWWKVAGVLTLLASASFSVFCIVKVIQCVN